MAQENGRIVRALCGAINGRDWDAWRQLLSDDCEWVFVERGITGGTLRGGVEVAAAFKQWTTTFPDLRMDIDNLIVAGETVVAEWSARGTQHGPLKRGEGWYPATGRSFTRRGCWVAELHGGRIVRFRAYTDAKTLLDQLGLASTTPHLLPP
ncbi:MAG TPA: nuclear transport factor 2 family protein [Methylomirabilota bacterium]|nr:nuclear transport factor 2 family protein [Methylomirabilota bacterium]